MEPTGTFTPEDLASVTRSSESMPSHVLQQLLAGLLASTPVSLQLILHSPQAVKVIF